MADNKIIEEITLKLNNAKKISDEIEFNNEYKLFKKQMKEVIDTGIFKNTVMQNPFKFLLKRLPKEKHKFVKKLYSDYFSKYSDAYKQGCNLYLGENMEKEDVYEEINELIYGEDWDKDQNMEQEITLIETLLYGANIMYYGNLKKKLTE